MKFLSVEVKNFMSLGHIFLDLSKPGLRLVLGKNEDEAAFSSNGSGKTALFSCIMYALYGQDLKNLAQDDYLRNISSYSYANKTTGTKELTLSVKVTIDPEDGTLPFYIQRTRRPGKSSLFIKDMNGDDLFPISSITEAQSKIDKLIGLNFKAFSNSIYFGKNLSKFFTSVSDDEKKDILDTILGIFSFDSQYDSVKQDFQKLETLIKDLLLNINVSTRLLESKEVDKNSLDKELQENKQAYLDYYSKYVREKTLLSLEIEELKEKKNTITKRLEELKVTTQQEKNKYNDDFKLELDSLEKERSLSLKELKVNYEKSLTELKNKYNKIVSEVTVTECQIKESIDDCKKYIQKLNNLISLNNDKIKSLRINLDKYRSLSNLAICTFCEQPISAEHCEYHATSVLDQIKLVEKQNIDHTTEVKKFVKDTIEPLEKSLLEITTSKKKVETEHFNAISLEQQNYDIQLSSIDSIFTNKKVDANNNYVTLFQSVDMKHEEEKNMLLSQFEDINNRFVELTKQQKDSDYKNTTYEKIILDLENKVAKITREVLILKSEISDVDSKIKQAELKLPYFNFWMEGFSSTKGIRSFLFEGCFPFINERINHYSSYLTGGTVKISVSPIVQARTSGNVKEKINIQVTNDFGSPIYDSLSDGERRRVDLCILLALRDLVGSNSTKDYSLVIFDEILDSLDPVGCERAIDLFKSLAKDKSVYIISHNDNIKQFFDETIIVKKSNGVSHLIE